MKLQNINFSYDDRIILKNVSLDIPKGEYVCLMGDNGSGKTTLMKIIAGLIFPQKGKYILKDQVITQKSLQNNQNRKKFYQKIGYLFQNSEVQLFNNTVKDEIQYGLLQMSFPENEINRRTKDILELLQIEELKDRNSIHLSGGEKKMVAFAAMLALNPQIILLDEPFNDLTRKNIFLLVSILKQLHESGKTIIMTCHEPYHVRNDVSDLIILKSKKVEYQGGMLDPEKIDKLL